MQASIKNNQNIDKDKGWDKNKDDEEIENMIAIRNRRKNWKRNTRYNMSLDNQKLRYYMGESVDFLYWNFLICLYTLM